MTYDEVQRHSFPFFSKMHGGRPPFAYKVAAMVSEVGVPKTFNDCSL